MALRASEDNVWKQLSTTERFFKRCAGHCQKNISKIIRKLNQNGPEILPKVVSGGHPSISGQTSDTGRISRPSREPCFAVSACLGDPLGTPRGPFGQPFRNLSPSGRAQDPKMMSFWLICFRMLFLHVFLWISETARTLKPWIPYGKGNKNHTFVRTRFFTVLATIWGPFQSRKRTQILFWVTLEGLVTTKAIKICD